VRALPCCSLLRFWSPAAPARKLRSIDSGKCPIALLYKWHARAQECRKIQLDGAAKIHPLVLLTTIETYSASDKLWADATSGRLTWGKFNEGRRNVALDAQRKSIEADAQITAQLQNQHQFELEQRARAAAAMQQWAYQQQALQAQQQYINAVTRPRTINCNYYGTTAQCSEF